MPLLTSYLKLSPLTTITMEGNFRGGEGGGAAIMYLLKNKRSTINWNIIIIF
jgi:hypothetical protein